MIARKVVQAVLLFISFAANAQLQEGKKNIEKLCGCFSVDFKYAETFAPDTNYTFHPREHQKGIELVLPVERTDTKIVLQHLLLVKDSIIVKHWREDWVYEQPTLLQYVGNKQWEKKTLSASEAKNKWVQTVWEVDDAPRYQGISQWVTTDGKTFWQNTIDAPLPRREYTKRSDYNILKRGNRIIVSDNAWWHEQDNQKVIKKNGSETLVAEEKGMNYYKRIADNKCEKAKLWWQTNGAFWNIVRLEWDSYINIHHTITLKSTIDNKRLDEYFTDLWKQWNSKTISTENLNTKIKTLVKQFTETREVPATVSRN